MCLPCAVPVKLSRALAWQGGRNVKNWVINENVTTLHLSNTSPSVAESGWFTGKKVSLDTFYGICTDLTQP